MALLGSAGGNVIPWKRADSGDFGRPEHARRISVGAQKCAVVYGRGCCVPRIRWRVRKDPRPAETMHICTEKVHLVHVHIYRRKKTHGLPCSLKWIRGV